MSRPLFVRGFLKRSLGLMPKTISQNPPPETQLITDRLILRMGHSQDFAAWHSVRQTSYPDLAPFEPSWPEDALTEATFLRSLHRHAKEWQDGTGYNFMIFLKGADEETHSLIGGITLNDVSRGVSQKGTIGYWMGTPYKGQGLMSEAVTAICRFATESLKLHRLEAGTMPQNKPSAKVLEKNAFQKLGQAPSYLKINGNWEDHDLWGRVLG